MADGGDHGWLTTLVAGLGAAVTALGTWAWTHLNKLVDGKADAKSVDAIAKRLEERTISRDTFEEHARSDERQLGAISKELDTQRGHVAKLFDKIEEAVDKTEVRFSRIEQQSHDRHVELMKAIHSIDMKGSRK